MSTPKLPAKLIELRGTARADRPHSDCDGAGPFNVDPPTWLPPGAVPAWAQIVERLPRVVMSSSDEILVATAAIVLTSFLRSHDHRAAITLKGLLVELGMSPMSRGRLVGLTPAKVPRFAALKAAGDEK